MSPTWTETIALLDFELRGWLYPDEISLVYRTDSDRRTAMLERRVELARLEGEAWEELAFEIAYDRERVRIVNRAYEAALRVCPPHATDEAERAADAATMKACAWAQEPDGGPWQTSCGNEFELIDGTPRDNGMAYCCYCGGSLEQIEYTDEAERAAGASTPTEEPR